MSGLGSWRSLSGRWMKVVSEAAVERADRGHLLRSFSLTILVRSEGFTPISLSCEIGVKQSATGIPPILSSVVVLFFSLFHLLIG